MSHTYVNGIFTELFFFFFQFFPCANYCECYKRLPSRSWSMLFTLTIFSFTYTLPVCAKIIVIAVFLSKLNHRTLFNYSLCLTIYSMHHGGLRGLSHVRILPRVKFALGLALSINCFTQ